MILEMYSIRIKPLPPITVTSHERYGVSNYWPVHANVKENKMLCISGLLRTESSVNDRRITLTWVSNAKGVYNNEIALK